MNINIVCIHIYILYIIRQHYINMLVYPCFLKLLNSSTSLERDLRTPHAVDSPHVQIPALRLELPPGTVGPLKNFGHSAIEEFWAHLGTLYI